MASVTISDLETILDRLHSLVKLNGEKESGKFCLENRQSKFLRTKCRVGEKLLRYILGFG